MLIEANSLKRVILPVFKEIYIIFDIFFIKQVSKLAAVFFCQLKIIKTTYNCVLYLIVLIEVIFLCYRRRRVSQAAYFYGVYNYSARKMLISSSHWSSWNTRATATVDQPRSDSIHPRLQNMLIHYDFRNMVCQIDLCVRIYIFPYVM